MAYLSDHWAIAERRYADPSSPLANGLGSAVTEIGLQHGGAVVPGRGSRGHFVLVSTSIPESERRVLAWMAKHKDITVYSMPPGFVTTRLEGQRYWLETTHIDTVIACIDSKVTRDGKAKLLVDPFYYDHIKTLPEFKRLINEQQLEHDVVLIEDEETDENLANVALGKNDPKTPVLVFNEGRKTLSRLSLKPKNVVLLKPSLRTVAQQLGLQRCLTQWLPAEFLDRKRHLIPTEDLLEFSSVFDSKLVEFVRLTFDAPHLQPMLKRMQELGVKKFFITQAKLSFTTIDAISLPTVACMTISGMGINTSEIDVAIWDLFMELFRIVGFRDIAFKASTYWSPDPQLLELYKATSMLGQKITHPSLGAKQAIEIVAGGLLELVIRKVSLIEDHNILAVLLRFVQLMEFFILSRPDQARTIFAAPLWKLLDKFTSASPPHHWVSELKPILERTA